MNAECAVSKSEREAAIRHCRRIKETYERVRWQKPPEGGYTMISRALWYVIEEMVADEKIQMPRALKQ